ncbi:hypothetical protein GOV04_01770 [Candidatus Woesearchaeota archaeon]|nr:hypothetical protein [Candidatus Woesearchaeota archaeon]
MSKTKNYRELEKQETQIFNDMIAKIDKLTNNVEVVEKKIVYQELKKAIIEYFTRLLKTADSMTEQELVEKFGTLNVKSDTIDKAQRLFAYMLNIDYNNASYQKEDLYHLLEEMHQVIEQIYIQTKASTLSKEEKLAKAKQPLIIKKFQGVLAKIKKSYKTKNVISRELTIKATEYYNLLSQENKKKYESDFHYYCTNLPYILELLQKAKEMKENQEELHQLIAKINKVFLKIPSEEQEGLSWQILKAIDSSEQKLNAYLMLGYNYIHSKKFNDARELYAEMIKYYNNLEEKKKKYYYNLLTRFLEHYTKAINKASAQN